MVRFKTRPLKRSGDGGAKNIKNEKVQSPPSPQKGHNFGCALFVEMEGIEPSSKQGSHTLSTCLFLPLVFVMQQDQDHQLHPYPLKFHQQGEAPIDYSRFYSTADQNASGQMAFWAMSRSPAWQGN